VWINEGYNGRQVGRFNLFLAPHDVWTARISALGNADGATLFSADTSCTQAAIPQSGLAFYRSSYAGGSIYSADGGPSSIMRTREGYVQVAEVGSVIAGSPLDLAIRHPAPSCEGTRESAGQYMSKPVGQISGSAVIVNVGEGTFFSYAADALAGFTDEMLFNAEVLLGSTPFQITNNQASTFPGGAVARVPSGDVPLELDFNAGMDAASAVFMENTIANDYLVAAGLGSHTDWVITFPTKPLYTDPYYVPQPQGQPPFVQKFHAPGVSNVLANAVQYDQEEGHGATSAITLPWVVNVVSFQSGDGVSGVLGSALTVPVAPFADAGTMSLDLAESGDESHALPAPDGRLMHGLPSTGFMVYNIINANAAPGKLANYGGAFPYRATVYCTTSAIDTTSCE